MTEHPSTMSEYIALVTSEAHHTGQTRDIARDMIADDINRAIDLLVAAAQVGVVQAFRSNLTDPIAELQELARIIAG